MSDLQCPATIVLLTPATAATNDAAEQVPWDAAKQVPWDIRDAAEQVPWDAAEQVPWDAAEQVPWDAAEQVPWDAAKQVPWGMRLSLVLLGTSEKQAEPAAKSLAALHQCELKTREIADGSALTAVIAELSDMYRGEQVAVAASEQAVCDALRLRAPPTAPIALAVDSDGWSVLSWETPQ